jgi:hypothetical protein
VERNFLVEEEEELLRSASWRANSFE